jgi:signal transduction histidine kinase
MNSFSRPDIAPPGSETVQLWVRAWNVISVGVALVTTIYSLVDQKNSPLNIGGITAFFLVFLAWYWIFIIRLDRWGRSSPILVVSFAVMMLLLAGMTTVHGIYYMQLFSMYAIIFSVMQTRQAIALSIFLSVLGGFLIIRENELTLAQSTGIIAGFSTAAFFSILFGLFISAIIRQSSERQQIIDELKAARADLAQAEREAGILEERQRLAREIHDTLAQGFTSIVMHLEAADQALPDHAALQPARQRIIQARNTARESLAEARRFVWALRSEPLERETLVFAIRRVAKLWEEETGIPTQVEISGDEHNLPSPFEVTLLRTTQEALANIRQHASARHVIITLTYMEDQVILDVQDDGQGFDASAAPTCKTGREAGTGFGLLGMRERAEQLGGSLIIESVPGEGTTLVVELPLSQPAHPFSEAS